MRYVKPKKQLGQHFLRDETIARQIVESLGPETGNVLEIGPGTGVLSKYLLTNPGINLRLIEVDRESVDYLHENYPQTVDRLITGDFLKSNPDDFFEGSFSIIGNFPYNISSQICFKVLEHRHRIPQVVGMLQKEVAERIASPSGSKDYGILSVLLQAYYDIEYLFTVHENVFIPPPKVKSAVIRLKRNKVERLECDEKLFVRVVKAAFNQRRKMLRNSLKEFGTKLPEEFAVKRPEQMKIEDFIFLTCEIGKS
jgi:16S rRNA (adenine1518-N6/adenine1519-N6)-dimethyltransferase